MRCNLRDAFLHNIETHLCIIIFYTKYVICICFVVLFFFLSGLIAQMEIDFKRYIKSDNLNNKQVVKYFRWT